MQLEKLLNDVRTETIADKNRKVSYLSDENDNVDTSNELTELISALNKSTNLNVSIPDAIAGPSTVEAQLPEVQIERTPEEEAAHLIQDSEKAKAHMYELPGKQNQFSPGEINFPGLENLVFQSPAQQANVVNASVYTMDEDYQMIDAHIEDSLKWKIVNFEYIDFCKLVTKHRGTKEDEHERLEIVNKNRMTYLAPVAE